MELLASFALGSGYSQIVVFDADVKEPFNDWLEQQVLQGFTWNTGTVSFGGLNHSCSYSVDLWIAEKFRIKPDSIRAIQVPFTVGPSASIGIQCVDSDPKSNFFPMHSGKYALIFETGFREDLREDPQYQGRMVTLLPTWCRFTFVPKKKRVPAKILRADEGLSPSYPLLLETTEEQFEEEYQKRTEDFKRRRGLLD